VRSAAPDVAVGVATHGSVGGMRGRGKLRKAVVSGSAFVSVVVSYESSFGSAQGVVNWPTLFAEYEP